MNGIDELLRTLLPELGAVRKASPDEAVRMAWPAVVGAALVPLAVPGRFDQATGFLEVRVEGPWREALFQMRRLLVERLRSVSGEIRGVRLVTVPVGSLRTTPAPAGLPAVGAAPPPAPDPRSEGVSEADLRAALDALCRAWDEGRDR